MKWFFILFLVCILCSFGAVFMGVHFFYLSIGVRPLIIDEPSIWLARIELLFSIAIAVLGFVGIYAITKLKQ